MSSATSAVTYTSVYTDSKPGRAFWGANDEEDEDGHEFLAEEQSLPPVDSPTAESPGHVTESDTEEDPEEYEDDETEDVTAALPSPPLPPSLYIPPPVDRRDDIPESEQASRRDAEERRTGIRGVGYRIRGTWVDPAEAVPEIVWMVEEEAYASREAWAHSIGLSQATHQELQTHHDHVYAHETHLQAHQTQLQLQSTLIQTQHQVHETRFQMQQAELAALRETDHRRQDQMVETLRVIRDMRREMSDMHAELLTLREQQRRARQPGLETRIPDHQDTSRDADSHINSGTLRGKASDTKGRLTIRPEKQPWSPATTLQEAKCSQDGGNRNVQGWVYAVGNAEKRGNASGNPDANIITGTFDVELADGKLVGIDTIIRGCTLNFLDHPFNIDLMPVELGSFDVIIGMDWLRRCHAVIVCDEKLVQIPYGNETLTFCGNESSNGRESRLTVISCSKAQEYMAKGCQVFLAQISAKKEEDKSEGKQIKDVPIVQDFPEVFPEDLPGLPPARPVEFQIDLIPGAAT
ncbi:putative reverse transcriptase domain-containing protein [Tanacetum coccineum]|uniref:Reverse transcriptase domain-containing protein n=1 Tax=Tanacetum coccineum TaxID=301880 RepID=A0ABQ4WWT0_9ASTR